MLLRKAVQFFVDVLFHRVHLQDISEINVFSKMAAKKRLSQRQREHKPRMKLLMGKV